MKKISLTLLLFCQFYSYSQSLIPKPRLNNNEINKQVPNLDRQKGDEKQTLPYPIIFIHGLDSNSEVWFDLGLQMITSGVTFGGRIDICLNDDGNNNIANKLIYPTSNADIALYTDYINKLDVGDIYWLNFDVDNFGRLRSESNFTDVLSNESAIVKQGIAVNIAIQIVLQKTGRDKVILMGHSMGGLASREYIQNPSNWQPDGKHHVAKLVTTGTPHGGFTGLGLSQTIDFQSEAFRDLKSSYSISGDDGIYLFGGSENYSTMNNNLIFNFYNVDVNCNGVDADNSTIIGLNEKNLPSNLDYAYIIGNCTNCQHLQGLIEGDGIVRSVNANLNNFYSLPTPRNEFIYKSSASTPIGLHSDLPKAIPVSMQGLDEPNDYNIAYEINLNQTYTGFITEQPVDGYPRDFDEYKINIPSDGNYNIIISNSFNKSISYSILDSNLTEVKTNNIAPNSQQTSFQHNLSSGSYYIEFISNADATSYQYPYTFKIENNTLSVDKYVHHEVVKAYPNPFSNNITIETNGKLKRIEIFNMLGQSVKIIEAISLNQNSRNLNLSELSNGNYILKITNENSINTIKINKM
jgi:hypothetical protein